MHHNGSTSIIDLVFLSNPTSLLSCVKVPPLFNSDHNGLLTTLKWKATGSGVHSSRRPIWRYAYADWEKACELIDNTNWDSLYSDDINLSWSNWQQQFMSIIEECIPKGVLPPRKNLPWLNKNLICAMRKRNQLYRKAKQSGDFSKYKLARNRVVSNLRRAKRAYFRNLNPKNPKKFWKAMKYLNKSQCSIPTLSHDDATVQTDIGKADLLNSFFSSCYNLSHSPLVPSEYQNSQSPQECPDEILCNEEEVYQLLSSLDVTKANGPDGISARALKQTATSITPSITKLFNLSLRTGHIPSEWKQSLVVPKNDKGSPNNYRPISLLSVLSKLLERHVHKILAEHLCTHHPLSNSQWGFSVGKSTVTALLTTTHEWFQQLEEGKEICAVFFDFKKAFNSVPHRPLITKLQQIGIPDHMLVWISNYLTDRSQKVVVNGATSESMPVLSGVPQGSVLGPLLFLIYIDGITSIPISSYTKIVLYADDLLLFRPISQQEDFTTLQRDIMAIEQWVLDNHLTFNTSKCSYMMLSRKRFPTTPLHPLMLSGLHLNEVECFKYLGVLLSSDLSWTPHITSVCSKAKKILGLLYRRFYNHAEGDTLKQLYLSLIRPHLEYACPVWDPHTMKDKVLLEDVQKFAFRMATKQWDSGYQDLLDIMNVLSLADRRLQLRLSLLYKIVHGMCYFPSDIFCPRTNYSHRTNHSLVIDQPYARTNAYFYSFVPHTISAWNSLHQQHVTAPSVSAFKYYFNYY